MSHAIYIIEKGVTADLSTLSRNPHSYARKQVRTVHTHRGVNLQNSFLCNAYLGIFDRRNKSQRLNSLNICKLNCYIYLFFSVFSGYVYQRYNIYISMVYAKNYSSALSDDISTSAIKSLTASSESTFTMRPSYSK